MSHHTPITAIARIALLAGVLLAILLLPTRAYQPAHAQDAVDETFNYAENRTDEVVAYTAIDPEGATITWSIDADSSDNEDFSFDDGELTFNSPPNFEDPKGGGSNGTENTYVVNLRASDGDSDNDRTWTLTINVTNVDESGTVALTTEQPKEGTSLTASLTDEDGTTENVTWQWARCTSRTTNTCTNIKGATTAAYMPKNADVGSYLRATASYTHPTGLNLGDEPKTAYKISSNAVVMKEYVDTTPVFKNAYGKEIPNNQTVSRSVPENSSAGTRVGEPVVATDIGPSGKQENLTYTLVNADDSVSNEFVIHRQTGQISVKANATINHEALSGSSYQYTVKVTATDPADKSDSINVVITVTNVNDAPVIAAETADAGLTSKNHQEDADSNAVSSYSATDDEDTNTTLQWSLSGDDGDKFTFNPETGASTHTGESANLSFKTSPDFEAKADKNGDNDYKVTVTVTDNGGSSDSRNVTVTVTNAEESGSVTLSNQQPEVGANIKATVSDPDGIVGSVTWQWATSSASGPFFAGETKDNYTPKAGDEDNSVNVHVRATYTDGTGTERTVNKSTDNAVQAKDADNKTPAFKNDQGNDLSSTQRNVDENTASGQNIGTPVTAQDDDTDDADDNLLTYSLDKSRDYKSFNINSGSGQLTTKAPLDYEKKSSYTVTVRATDPSAKSDTITVTIKVNNLNEFPTITGGDAAIFYPENGTGAVGTYTATDPEDDRARPKKALKWSLTGGADQSKFTISSSGALTFNDSPDFDARADADPSDNRYQVTVTVTDSSASSTSRQVTVTVTDVNEDGSVTLTAEQPQVDVQLTATLTDPDGGPGDTPDIDDDERNLTTDNTTLWQWATSTSKSGPWNNIETATSNTYTATTTDIGSYLRATATYTDRQRDASKTVHKVSSYKVQAKDYSNTAPMFLDDDGDELTSTSRKILENSSPGTKVGKPVAATDRGRDGSQERLTYTLSDHNDGTSGDSDRFTIHRQTGQISLGGSSNLDRENPLKTSYVITVTATDSGGLTGTIKVTINVTDVNDKPKIAAEDPTTGLTSKNYQEGTDVATRVSSYSATDAEDTDSTLTWSLSGDDSDKFNLSAPTGASTNLVFRTTPDFEAKADKDKKNDYEVTVTVTDSKTSSDSRDVTVTVTNKEESGTATLLNLYPQVGTSITAKLTDPDNITSSNPDGNVTSNVKWKWATSTADNIIQRSSTSGSYTPVAGDENNLLFAIATYTDGHGSGKTATARSANNVLEKPATADTKSPVFCDQDTTLTGIQNKSVTINILEGSVSSNTNITIATNTNTDQVRADDDDHVACNNSGDQLTYSLEGNDAKPFDITAANGQLIRKAGVVLDYETKNKYSFKVKATDPSARSSTINVTINVTDDNEEPAIVKKSLVITGPGTFDYPEDETNRQVATYRAVGPEGTRRWSKSGDDAGDFQLSSAGTLSFSSQPNFELPADADTDNVYEVTLQATVGDITDTYDVTVTVTNAEEAGTVTLSPTSRPRVGTAITAALTDPDSVTSANTTGSITTGVTWQWSKATATTGAWSDISGATEASYTPADDDADNFLRATASYAAGQSAVATTTQTVLALTATPNDGTVTISPAQPVVGTAVTARLTDPDGAPTGVTWQWAWSTGSSAGGTWTPISGATGSSYTPVETDVGRYLRATASYSDAVDGADQTASAISASAVTATVAVDEYDRNADGRIDSTEVLEAVADYFAGTLSQARVLQVVALYFAGLPPTS